MKLTSIKDITDEKEKLLLLEFYKQFEYCLGIEKEFPKYLHKKIENELEVINFHEKSQDSTVELLRESGMSFYSYLKESEMKYYSKLIARPISLILRHEVSEKEKELFVGDLFHVIGFKYWHNNVQFEISDNFYEVYREWLKE